MSKIKEEDNGTGVEVAIIGMAGRFPGAKDIDEFWDNLKNGVESILFYSEEELELSMADPALVRNPNYIKTNGGILENKEYFDAAFFDYTPLEAEIMDPQIRIFLECTWEALEVAGYNPDDYEGLIGVYAGASPNFIWEALTYISGKSHELGTYAANNLSGRDFLATTVAYKFNLKGPAVFVQTACSTSLVAVHLACQAILDGECDMALAGGVMISPLSNCGYLYQEGMIQSADGHCRAFDHRAKGTIGGNGVGVVVLKALEEAITDKDYIHAVIKGTAINNDGREKAGFTAPSIKGQAEVIRTAQQVAEVEPESIGYVEAHGTGTSIGDPIEIEALKQAFDTDKKGFCALGSVKTNIGHLDVAAGIAGLIKTILALKYKLIPVNLHFEKPNPKIDFENSPFYVNTTLKEWKNPDGPLIAGVSSFGIGGTNAHVILEEWPNSPTSITTRTAHGVKQEEYRNQSVGYPYQLIVLSAKTQSVLSHMTVDLLNYFKKNSDVNIANVAHTLQVGRKVFKHRKMMICITVKEAIEALSTPTSEKVYEFVSKGDKPVVVFMFPGQGAQYVNMGLDLYGTESVFREEMNHCFEILKPLLGYDIKEILYPDEATKTQRHQDKADPPAPSHLHHSPDINQTEVTQPLLFLFEYALAKLLMQWGINPYAMIGHSIGEYVAACLAGVFSLEDALKLVVSRGQLMQQMPPGAMLSAAVSEEELKLLLDGELSLAAVNSPLNCVVSGTHEAIDTFEKELSRRQIETRRLHTSHAFHSKMMDPILDKYLETVENVKLNTAKIPYISNLNASWITSAQLTDPLYWVKHLRSTVRFSDGIKKLSKEGNVIFVEIGPGKVLSTLTRQHIDKKNQQKIINIVRHPKEQVPDGYYLLSNIGHLWLYGIKINWNEIYTGERRYRLPLPPYPFERKRYWIDGDLLRMKGEMFSPKHLLQRKNKLEDFFYIPLWKPSLQVNFGINEAAEKSTWLIFTNECGFSARLVKELEKKHFQTVTVRRGIEFSKINEREFRINPRQPDDYYALVNELCILNNIPQIIVHLWHLTGDNRDTLDVEAFEKSQYSGFYSLIYLAQAIRKKNLTTDFQITVISNHMQEVTGEERLSPEKSTVLAPLKVIPQEFLNIICRSIDITVPEPGSWQESKLISHLLTEISTASTDTIIAYRNNRRWVQIFETGKLDKNGEIKPLLKRGGVYLVTGGLGNIGFVLANHLARNFRARLILTGRSLLPEKKVWEGWLTTHSEQDNTSQKIRKLQDIESLGGQVLFFNVDVSNQVRMQEVIEQAEKRFGQINGVIHAAGVTKGKSNPCAIENISVAEGKEQFRPKVYGLLVLERILKDKKIDFFLLFSSLSSVLGGLGFTVYSAANIFMDAFVKTRDRFNFTRWISVNWDGWQLEEKQHQLQLEGEGPEGLALTPEQGIEAFQRILSWPEENQVVVSTKDLHIKIDQWIKLENQRLVESISSETSPLQPRPDMTTPYVGYRSQVEQILTHIWQKFFGFEKIGIMDDFFQLGGDSLKAMTVVSKIHKNLNVSIPLLEFFNRPTIQKLAEYIENAEKDTYFSIEPSEKKEYYTVSSAQKRTYILSQLDSENIAYNLPEILVSEKELDKVILEETFKRLIFRHESLRSSFGMIDGEPFQKVHDEVEFEIECYNSGNRQQAVGNREDEIPEAYCPMIESIIEDFIRPFDLSQAPLLRVGIIKTQEGKHLLMIDMHHIISDGVSHSILIHDFTTLYKKEELPPLKVQYKDFSEWQSFEKQKKVIEQQKNYWLNQFEGEIPILNIHTDYPRPEVQRFEGSVLDFEIGGEETRALNYLAIKQGTTLYVVLLAIFNLLLSKITHQEDIIIGTPVAGRRHVNLEQIIGMFVNTLAMRNFPESKKKFPDFLLNVKENTLNAFENQDYPFEELVEEVAVNRDVSRNPLFDVMFVFQNIELPKVEIPGLVLLLYEYKSRVSKFDLTLFSVETGEKLLFTFEYCTELFKQETIKHFISFFKQIVSSILNNPYKKISQIEIISEVEKRQILMDFNNTAADFPKNKTIQKLFEEQAGKTPDNIAIIGTEHGVRNAELGVGGGFTAFVSYKELNNKSNQLACLLKEKGIQSDAIAGIMVERSFEMIIGILGILKAGGAYLPIDPGYPWERINYMLADSNARVLLKSETSPNDQNQETVCTVLNFEHLDFEFVSNFDFRVSNSFSSNLAYVIYTSGSTGKPKGVMVEHRSVVNRLNWMQRKYPIGPRDMILQKTPFTFDVSVWELFWWSFQGASLRLLSPGEEKNPGAIVKAIAESHATIIHFVPSMMNAFLEYVGEPGTQYVEALPTLKQVFSSGETLTIQQVERFNTLFYQANKTKLANLYGPTEATVDVSYFNCPSSEKLTKVPIGKPIDNIHLYVVDRKMSLQPIGVTGELCISGDGVARGYLNRPELTAEKFIQPQIYTDLHRFTRVPRPPHSPTHPLTHSTIYRTGDLARWLPDGNIEFLGRIDHQVKIRGFRVELAEIECQLLNHNEIKEAVVVSKEDKKGNISLYAYFVSGKEFTVTDLRNHLSKSLPDYMLPYYFIPLDKIPLTTSGKVDKNSLPGPGAMDLSSDMVYIGARNIIEKKLTEVWQKVLGINTVSINDNFFEIGGDSIKTIQAVSRMKKAGYKLEMRDIFQNPRISRLALLARKIERIADQSVITGTIPLTPIQRWFFESILTGRHHFNQAVIVVFEKGFNEEVANAVFTKIQEHHDALRIIYKKSNETIIQVNQALAHPLSLQVFDYRGQRDPGNLVESKASEIQASINLETGPLMKLGLFHLDDGDRLLIAIHHLVIDGVSWRILLEDIETVLLQYRKGEPLVLPLKTDSFKVWSEELSQYANSDLFLKEKTYWAELESKQVQELKKDFEDEDNYMKDVELLSFSLKEIETHLLLTKVNDAFGTGINDILLTALGLAIKRVYGNNRLLITSEGHGREDILKDVDVSRTVGWFTSLYPVLLDFSYENEEDPDRNLARQIKEVKEYLHQVPRKGVGYGILKYLTSGKNKKEINFKLNSQVVFNYLGQFDEDLKYRSFKITQKSAGYTHSPDEQREFEIEVSGIITNKRLTMSISYNKKQYKLETITELLNHFERELIHIITYCSSRRKKEFSPSDFAYTGLSIETLEQLQEQHSYLIGDIYTLTPMQEGMLFYALYENKSRSTYFEQMSYRLQGELNIQLVEKSLNELFKRHDALRTVFVHEDINRPVQVVLRERNVDFRFEDLRESILSPEDKEIFVREFREKDRQCSFDLSKDVLMRVAVHQLGDAEYQVTWSSHHILMDGWCIGILISEFFEIYTSYLENRAFKLPQVEPYRTYIQWLEKQEKNKTKNYWKNYLDGYEEIAALPKKKKTIIFEGGFNAATVSILFEEEKTVALNKVAIRNNVTLNTVLQVAWGIVLGKYCSKQDVVFGVLISGRPPEIEGVESMIGCFINTIPIRITFDENAKFNKLLRSVQEKAIESEPHYYYSLAEIQAESTLKQNLLDHIIEFQNYPAAERIEGVGDKIKKNKTTGALKLSDVNVSEEGNYDFYVVIIPGSQVYLGFSYNTNVYDNQLVEQLGFNSMRVLEQIIDDETVTIGEIVLLSENEKRKILFEFNDNRADFPRDKTIYQLIEKFAEITPDRIALVGRDQGAGGTALTYRELDERANRLAIVLRSSRIQKDEPVGILMERSQFMVESILAVWKAGGAYMPIDPGYPDERIDHMLSDSKAKVLVTTSTFSEEDRKLRTWEGRKIFFEEVFKDNIASVTSVAKLPLKAFNDCPKGSSSHRHLSPVPVTSLAYIIYTSGSTGKPKGVMIEHIGMMNHIQVKINDLRLTEQSIVAQNATHIFDISVWQFFAALTLGGETIIYPDELILDPGKFVSWIIKDQITILEIVPSYLSVLLDYIENQHILQLPLQYLLVTGEELKPHLVRKWFDQYPDIKMVNAYGPTEASDDITHYIMDKAPDMERIPIGRPLQNLNVYIVDHRMQLCPVGVRGEICVSGVGVGRGYLGDEENTTQVFMEDPFAEEKGVRLYKTGDLGSWRQDGTIEFYGRKDYQVKIRGFRIELGEIENRLLNHRAIKETVVIDREDKVGNKYLCAYIVAQRESHGAWPMELREFLSGTLPDYMIPEYFVQLESIPLTSNGKVDRKSLPEPEDSGIIQKYVPPENTTEEKLVEIWSEVLGKEKGVIGINHSFFDFGGHSLKAIVLVSKVHKEFDVKLPLAELFKTPTIRDLSNYIKKASRDRYVSIYPVEKKEYYTLSSAQKRMYILQQMELENTAYNLPEVIPLAAEPDRDELEKTFIKLIQRHESLSASFHMVENEPVQKIHDHVEFRIEYYELPGSQSEVKVEENNQDREGHSIVSREQVIKHFGQPFDLSRAPLLKAGIVKIGVGRYVLVVVMHHIISDRLSHDILVKNFIALYEGKELSPLRIQYKDFSEWQNKEKQREEVKQQEDYWLKEFEGEIPVLNIPTDYPRPVIQSFEGDTVSFEIPGNVANLLKAIALKEKMTLYMVLLAVFDVLLAKLSNQEDIVIGTPIAGRRHTDLEFIIGMFVNTLALRNFPNREKIFKKFLLEVKERTMEAFENQEYQLEELVEKAAVNRDASRNPLFDVMYAFQQVEGDVGDKTDRKSPKEEKTEKEKASVSHPQRGDQPGTSKFDLTLNGMEAGENLFFTVEYSTKLFKEETIKRFISYFKETVSLIVKEPGIMLWQIEIISEAEKQRILYHFNDTDTEYPKDKTIHQLFEEQVERIPDHIALVEAPLSVGMSITYKELNVKSNQLSHTLRKRGVTSDTVVAMVARRSIAMIQGILGVLKSGGAYLPVEPAYPLARINYILEDSTAKFLLIQQPLIHPLATNCELINLDDPDLYTDSKKKLPQTNPPGDLAYVLYTSGSTGSPKGVMIEHDSVVNLLFSLFDAYPFEKKDTFLFKTSYIFDVSVTEIFGWVLGGGRIAILENEAEKDPQQIVDVIARLLVSHVNFVPSMFRVFTDWLSPQTIKQLSSLKYIFLAGEVLLFSTVNKFRKLDSKIQVENIYGPTEATIYASQYSLSQWEDSGSIPIGKPLPNIRLYILDPNDYSQPIGVPGELCTSGIGLARGYLNNPELTAEKFCRKHFLLNPSQYPNTPIPQYPIYRTGDLARWLPDGNIEFLGRIDHQIKIRGYRVELGEIQNQILKHPEIKEVVVLSKEGQNKDIYLCAYIVSNIRVGAADLREYLSHSLPDYMIPAHFVCIENIPLTPSGKVDRKRLPASELESELNYTAPQDEIEEKLVEIWTEVLVRDALNASPGQSQISIGIDDNFFQLGGHSLKAVIMLSKAHKALNVKIPLAEVFKTPSIRGLSRYIKGAEKNKYLAIKPVEKKEYYTLSSAQKRLYILQQMELASTAYNMPEVIPLVEKPDLKKFEDTFIKLIKRHEALRTSFYMVNHQPMQKVHDEVEFTIAYFEVKVESKVEEEIIHYFDSAFDLSRAPLLKVGIVKADEEKYVLVVVMHHIISDAVSHGILVKDFMALYHGKSLSPLRIQYKDFSQWQNKEKQKEHLKQQQTYWLKEFEGEIPELNIPTDYKRTTINNFEGSDFGFIIGVESTKKLKDWALEENVTLFMILLAVFNVFLVKITGQEDIVVGTPVMGRRHPDLDSIIGMFVNMLALRNYPSHEKRFTDFLKDLKETTLNAFQSQDYQFEDLVDQVLKSRDAKRNPLFDVVFSIQDLNQENKEEIPRVQMESSRYKKQISKFDLTLVADDLGKELHFNFEYKTKLFKKKTIEMYAKHFKEVVSVVLMNKDIQLKDIKISHELVSSKSSLPQLDFGF